MFQFYGSPTQHYKGTAVYIHFCAIMYIFVRICCLILNHLFSFVTVAYNTVAENNV